MKIVIDIPEDVVVNDLYANYFKCMSEKLYEVLQNGTPLKGHGRLIDADELLKCAFVRKDDEGDIFVSQYYCIEKCDFDNLQTIIEADKAESRKRE